MELLQDRFFLVEFDPTVKGQVAYDVYPDGRVELVPKTNVWPLRDWDFFTVRDGELVSPDMKDAWYTQDPNRVRQGSKALKCHGWGRYDAGWTQTVELANHGPVTFFARARNLWVFRNSDTYIDEASLRIEDGKLVASAYMHAWSNHDIPGFDFFGDPGCSCGVGCGPVVIHEDDVDSWIETHIPNATPEMKDAVDNFSFTVGIDPDGGINPLADTVVWSDRWHIYNGYAQKIEMEYELAPPEHPEPPPPIEPPEPPEVPEPVDLGTKLGPHVIKAEPGVQEHISTGPVVVQLIGDWASFDLPKDSLVIGRKAEDEYSVEDRIKAGADPIIEAAYFFNMQYDTYVMNPHIEYWTGPNEPTLWGDDINDEQFMTWYCMFEKARIELMWEVLQRRCVIGNFATGCPPDMGQWVHFLPAIEGGMEYKIILGVHEYSHPWTFWMTGSHQLDPEEDIGRYGYTTLRYRFLYDNYLIPAGLVVPLVMTECGIDALVNPKPPGAPDVQWKDLGPYWADNHEGPVPYPGDRDGYYFKQLAWYDERMREDFYVIGGTIFAVGTWPGEWRKFDILQTEVINRVNDRILENPPAPFKYENYLLKEEDEEPIQKYDRHVIMADPTYMSEKQLDDSYAEGRRKLRTVGPSWQDAVAKKKYRPPEWETNTVYAGLLPEELRPTYIEYVKNRDPDTILKFDDLSDPWDIDLVDEMPRRYDLPQWPDGKWTFRELSVLNRITIHHLGAYITDLHAHALAYLNKENGRPAYAYTIMIEPNGVSKKLLHLTEGNWHDHSGQSHKHLCLGLNGALHQYPPTEAQYNALIKHILWAINHPEMNIEADAIDGHDKYIGTKCPGWWQPPSGYWKFEFEDRLAEALEEEEGPYVPPIEPLGFKIGMHDQSGVDWMVSEGLAGAGLVHWTFDDAPAVRDFSEYEEAGIELTARIGYGYSHGRGTAPRPEMRDTWIQSAIATILETRGVARWHIFNEPNNKSEWPGYGSDNMFELTPEYIVGIYNEIWDAVSGYVDIGPPPLDPYFGPGSDNSIWWNYILANINGADALFLHAKTQGSDPAQVWSTEMFEDIPLTWQFQNCMAIVPYIDMIPTKYATLPLIVSEANSQRKHDGSNGWEPGNAAWVEQSANFFKYHGVNQIIYYRWHADEWALYNRPVILEAIKDEIKKL